MVEAGGPLGRVKGWTLLGSLMGHGSEQGDRRVPTREGNKRSYSIPGLFMAGVVKEDTSGCNEALLC